MLVLKNCGPKGYPGFPEVGNFALPAKMLKKGVTDMVRISDARMSGTAYGTVVLHTAPEAAAGGPLALVRNGDLIELDVAQAQDPPARVRRGARAAQARSGSRCRRTPTRGWVKLYCDTVLQADKGVDLDFLVGKSGAKVGTAEPLSGRRDGRAPAAPASRHDGRVARRPRWLRAAAACRRR